MANVHRDSEPIDLAGGWSGYVLGGSWTAGTGEVAATHRPTLAQWKRALTQVATDPASMPGYTLLKYSKDGEVFRARLAAGGRTIDIVCKQSRGHGLMRRIAGAFRPSRERRNFARGLMLLRAGINTAMPLAVIERRRPHGEAWLVTSYVPNLVDLDQVALQLLPSLPVREAHRVKRTIAEAIVDLLVRMEQHSFTHRDLKASNILLKDRDTITALMTQDGDGGGVSLWLVDLDGLQRRQSIRAYRRWQPVVRLAASLQGHATITRSDYAAFLRHYLARSDSYEKDWKRRYRELARRASDYARRATRRKAHKLDGYIGDS